MKMGGCTDVGSTRRDRIEEATWVGRLQRLTHMPAQPLSARYLHLHVSSCSLNAGA